MTSMGSAQRIGCDKNANFPTGVLTMEKRLVALAAAAAGLAIGVAGAGVFMHAQAAIPNAVCAPYDVAAEARADVAAKQLRAHDHDQYVPHPARSPFGDAPKATTTEPAKVPAQ
jgi:hypothetical protein